MIAQNALLLFSFDLVLCGFAFGSCISWNLRPGGMCNVIVTLGGFAFCLLLGMFICMFYHVSSVFSLSYFLHMVHSNVFVSFLYIVGRVFLEFHVLHGLGISFSIHFALWV